MASTNLGLFFGFSTFWIVLITLVGIVSGSIAISANDGSYTDALDSAEADAGFVSGIFVGVAQNLFNNLGFETSVILGFASLPDWLNLALFVPLLAFTVLTIIVVLIPGVG